MFLEQAGKVRHHMKHDQDGGGQTGGETSDDASDRFKCSRRAADHDDVALWQDSALCKVRGNSKVSGWFEGSSYEGEAPWSGITVAGILQLHGVAILVHRSALLIDLAIR